MGGQDWLRQGSMLAGILLISVYIINCGYLFEGTCTPLEKFQFRATIFAGYDSIDDVPLEGDNRFAGTWLGKLPVPLPANMVQGIDTQRYDFERGLPSYLRGQWADHGWWYYYLYALAVKVPLGTWCLVVLALAVTIFGRGYSASWRDEMLVLAPFVVILVFVSSQTGFSVHSRYVIPTLPFLFVWTSKIGRVFERRPRPLSLSRPTFGRRPERGAIFGQPLTQRRQGTEFRFLFVPWRLWVNLFSLRSAVVLMLAWSVGSSLSIYPHSLSYFNELAAILPTPADASYPQPIGERDENRGVWSKIKYALTAGPRNGPRHLLDSNIDWGQDLLYLKDWLDKHPDVKLDGLAYYGSYPATLAGIPETPQPPPGLDTDYAQRDSSGSDEYFGPKPGWYALSVNYIYSRDHQYRFFLHFQPVAMAGYSIYIYHITLEEANRVRRELGLKELAGQQTGERGEGRGKN